jgi:hypothetical protein
MPAFGEQFSRYYPGLIQVETDLWRAFLREHETEYDRFEYNVHVGQGVNVPERPMTDDPELDRKLREAYRLWTQKKIDVVGFQGPAYTIFEVEERPGTRALGQLLTYRRLLNEQRPPIAPTILALVARRLGHDMEATFREQGVAIYLVEPGPPG